jgi:hypothetical protein
MSEIPADLKATLEGRVREQIACEVRGHVSALYEFTLPAIRARRIAERHDEPELSLAEIGEFVGLVNEAEVQSIHIESFYPSVERFSGCPVARVVTSVRYNRRSQVTTFRCLWVYSDGMWFSTSLGKVRFAAPLEADKGAS